MEPWLIQFRLSWMTWVKWWRFLRTLSRYPGASSLRPSSMRLHITPVNCTRSPGNRGSVLPTTTAVRHVVISLPWVSALSILGHTDTKINTTSIQSVSPEDFTKWKMKSNPSRDPFGLTGLVFFKFCFSSSNANMIHHLPKFKPHVDFQKLLPVNPGTQMLVGPFPSILVNAPIHQTFPHN